jgi:tetratricopeptide (TPR) repeat protein
MNLAGHRVPRVRRWACERLETLYGKSGQEVLGKLLKDPADEVLLEALRFLESYPDQKFSDLVLEAYETRRGDVAGGCALMLGKLKDERLIPRYEMKKRKRPIDVDERIWVIVSLGELGTDSARSILRLLLSDIKEDTDPYIIEVLIGALLKAKEDMAALLEPYSRLYRERGMEILYPLIAACGSWHNLEDLKIEGKKKFLGKGLPPAVEECLAFLKGRNYSALAGDLQQAFAKGDYRRVVETAGRWARESMGENKTGGAGVKEDGSLERGIPPWINLEVLKAFMNYLKNGPEDSFKWIAVATLAILEKFVEFKSLWNLKGEEVDPKDLFPLLFEDRDSHPLDELFIRRVISLFEPAAVFVRCLQQLKEHPESYGTKRAVRLLGELKDPAAIPHLLPLLEREEIGDLKQESIQAMVQIGPPLVDYLEKGFPRLGEDQLLQLLFALRDIPEEKTVHFLIAHWDKLWSIDKEAFLGALEGIGSRQFIDPLRNELREGEEMDEEIFYLLCHLHGVRDPLLPSIEESLAERKKRKDQRLEGLQRNDLTALRQNTATVELKCRRCAKSYSYEIEKILVQEKKGEPLIGDKIVCKNCRAINQYEITAKGHLAITGHLLLATALMEKENFSPGPGPVHVGKLGLVDGRSMSREQAEEYYRKEVQKAPQDPGLRVGYGNVLINQGKEEEAVRQYKEALKLDPLAVEAYASLGEYEADKGNFSGAYEYFRDAAERMNTGHYYRSKEVDQVKEAIFLNLEHFAEMLGKPGPKPPAAPLSQGIIKQEKIGRNAPCPCGSGKKYKKCCLSKEEGRQPEKTSATPVELGLRDQLLAFSGNEKYKKDFEKAHAAYYRKPFREPLVIREGEEDRFQIFLDWFLHDFKRENGLTLIEEFFQSKKETLTPEERSLLQYEISSHLSLYEVLQVTPEVGLRLKDLFTAEELDTREVRGSRTLTKWDLILARVIRAGQVNKFSGIITLLSRRNKEGILASVGQAWEKFKKETGRTGWSDFAKIKGEIIHHLVEDQPRVEPVLVTEEHHPVVSAKAIFQAKNPDPLRFRLQKEFDFILDSEEEGKEMVWTWLKRGESKDWEAGKEMEQSIIFKSEMIRGSGELRWTSLGTVTWTPGRLELWCLSRERLARGKRRLREILGDDIRHLADTFEDLKKLTKKVPQEDSPFRDNKDRERYLPFYSKAMEDWMIHWVDEKIPALDGKTPREAVMTPEGRKRVEELLKDFENAEERKKRDGEPYIDIQYLKQKLNL